ncbi:MAG: tetratricopeptide repeat protein [Bryobacteraceae bacterium]
MIENAKLALRLYVQPGAAMSEILDRGSLLFASLAVLAISLALPFPFRFYTPLLILAVVYVPGVLLLVQLLGRLGGGFGMVFRRDYAPLLTCTAMAWTAANLPLWLALRVAPQPLYLPVAGAAYLYFLFLMFFVVRTVSGAGNGVSIAVVSLSWLPLLAAAFLWGPLRFVFGWIASPFFLFFAYYYLGGEIGNLGAGLRSRQSFYRTLQAAAVNPHDAGAQYQLGLMYQQRRELTKASERFRAAVAIDPGETGAHFQSGRIAREQGRLQDALGHFQTVLDQDTSFQQSEILRELGALYIGARQFNHAWDELAVYVERRPYDPEGLFYAGQALEGAGKTAEAREMYARVVEAVRTAPRYRQATVAKWSRLAQKQMRRLG